MKVFLKTEDEIELMRQANQLVGKTLGELAKHIKPGVTTLQLDRVADEFIRDHGAVPTFKGFPNPYGGPFPASICTSVNEVVVHGVPSEKTVLKDGDIISIDCGTLLNGFNGDSAYTFCVGEVSEEVRKLLQVTRESLYKGIENAVAGKHGVISVLPCRTIVRQKAMVWSESLQVTALDKRCMKIHLFPIMDVVVTASC
jgi:methionyl aminopeptidase